MPPKGRSKNYKGRSRHFTSPEEVEAQRAREEKEKAWKQRKNVEDEDDEKESGDDSEEESSESSSGEEGEGAEEKKKGVEGLIEIENPNRAVQKSKKTATEEGGEPEVEKVPELSRREREEIQKQKARAHHEKMHAAGKTEQARADLARLAIIRKQREEQARKKAEEKRLADEKAAVATKK